MYGSRISLHFTDIGAGGLINPNKTYAEVEKESALGHELYVKSHDDFNVGEKLIRSYTSPNFQSTNKFGIPTPHDNTGKAYHINPYKCPCSNKWPCLFSENNVIFMWLH